MNYADIHNIWKLIICVSSSQVMWQGVPSFQNSANPYGMDEIKLNHLVLLNPAEIHSLPLIFHRRVLTIPSWNCHHSPFLPLESLQGDFAS